VEQIAETLSLPLAQVTEIANRSAEQWTLRSSPSPLNNLWLLSVISFTSQDW
jgi:hypothetical protein